MMLQRYPSFALSQIPMESGTHDRPYSLLLVLLVASKIATFSFTYATHTHAHIPSSRSTVVYSLLPSPSQ